jgi:hypothetical protein
MNAGWQKDRLAIFNFYSPTKVLPRLRIDGAGICKRTV